MLSPYTAKYSCRIRLICFKQFDGKAKGHGPVQHRGSSVALRVQRGSDRMQHSSVGCSIAQQGAAQLNRVQRSSIGCSVAQKGATGGARGRECYILKPRWSSGKIFDPGGPSSGLKEALVSGNSKYFLADEDEAAKLRLAGGAQRPVWYVNKPNKTGARSAPSRTRGQNPLVNDNMLYLS